MTSADYPKKMGSSRQQVRCFVFSGRGEKQKMTTIAIGYGKFRTPDWLDGIKILPGAKKMYEWLAMSARGQDHAYPTQEWLAKKINVTVRTIRNYTRLLVKLLLIDVREERIKGKKRNNYYFLIHPAMGLQDEDISENIGQMQDDCSQLKNESEKKEDERKNFPVIAEKFSAQLDKGKSCLENPPYPQRGQAADAAGESHELTQNHRTPAYTKMGADNIQCGSATSQEKSAGTASCPTGTTVGNQRDVSSSGDGNIHKYLDDFSHIWAKALESLESVNGYELWLKQLKVGIRNGRFVLLCPDEYFAAYVARHFLGAIRASIQQFEITANFSEQDLMVEDRIAPVIAQQRIQKKNEEEGWRKLNSLHAKEQFAALAAAYPRKSVGEYFAWRTFSRLRQRRELPDMAVLFRIVNQQKSSTDWNRDNGRWIPGLNKWLRNRPWWNSGSEERGKESTAFSAW
jgi:hypothetical protein